MDRSLKAAEDALSHFVVSLERAGFGIGANAYLRMSSVIRDQWLWAERSGWVDLYPRFQRVAELARVVEEQIAPYVQAMRDVVAVGALVATPSAGVEDSVADKILGVISKNERPMSLTAIRMEVPESTETLRQELAVLVRLGLISPTGSSNRPAYEAVRDIPNPGSGDP